MLIGLDFDNTIACYDQAIKILAKELFQLPTDLRLDKVGLRDFLRSEGREEEWTAFQGELYGPGMRYAKPFEHSVEVMKECVAAGHRLAIVSQRSRVPYAGRKHDLHQAAKKWIDYHLQASGVFSSGDDVMQVFFLETKEEKLKKIGELGCTFFVDDLPEILNSPEFPCSTNRILFKPGGNPGFVGNDAIYQIGSWSELKGVIG